MKLSHPGCFVHGLENVVSMGTANADMLMDFGILTLGAGDAWTEERPELERAYLLMTGEVELSWGTETRRVRRSSLFDESPWCLHVSASVPVTVRAVSAAELSVHRTENSRRFPSRLYEPAECRSDERGKGTMMETSTRIVRTVFDDSNAPEANLVLGEVINQPGRWSSYPPHHHPQPEIYHYRFLPGQGFGLCRIGDDSHLLVQNDTVLIREGQVHPQVAAPGYAMWYLWVIRHLDGNRYRAPYPIFVDEHRWVTDSKARFWEFSGDK